MKAVIQVVKKASVSVMQDEVASIGPGILAYIGVERGDDEKMAKTLIDKIVHMRIFKDEANKMTLSIRDLAGYEILLVSQFTLCADMTSRRPSFTRAMPATEASQLFGVLKKMFLTTGISVQTGIFQAHMEVTSINDGPETFLLDV